MMKVTSFLVLNLHDHAQYDQQVPQGYEDPEVPQALQELSYPLSDALRSLILLEGVWPLPLPGSTGNDNSL